MQVHCAARHPHATPTVVWCKAGCYIPLCHAIHVPGPLDCDVSSAQGGGTSGLSGQVWSCHATSCHIISRHIMSCHVMPCHVMSCHVMSHHRSCGALAVCGTWVQVEHIRAQTLSKATVAAEVSIKQADGQAEALHRKADAELYAETRRAEGVRILRQAQADGLRMVFEAAGGNPLLAQFYLGLETDLYVKLAEKTSEAVKGMQPKVRGGLLVLLLLLLQWWWWGMLNSVSTINNATCENKLCFEN